VSEGVYRILQLGAQSGTIAAPGSAAAATVLYPCEPGGPPTLDRGSAIPAEDVGRNIRNRGGRGYHGIRGTELPLASDVRFEDIMRLLEAHYAGGVTPSGAGPYTWVYPLEGATSTVKPYTIEEGVPSSVQDEWQISSAVLNDLTFQFDALAAPGAQPWRVSGTWIGTNRAITTLTSGLSAPAVLETVMGHTSAIYEGPVATAYGSLSELAASLIRFSMTSTRNFVRRPYGATSDVPTAFGFSDKTTATFEMLVKMSSTAKTDFYDVVNVAGGFITDRRLRIKATGSGTKAFTIDGRVSILQVNVDDRDGERVYSISGEYVDDTTLAAPVQVTVVNGVSALA
jgi:hypothetical protein